MRLVYILIILMLAACSISTPDESIETETVPTATIVPSETSTPTIPPDLFATQQAAEATAKVKEVLGTQSAQSTQNALETQIAAGATSQAKATKQALEAVENQKVNAFLNQVESEFFTDENLTISVSAGELHFADKLMENKNLDNWRLTKGETQYFLKNLFGLIVTNLAEGSSDPRIVQYRGLDRRRGDLSNSMYFVNIANSVKKGGPLFGQFCNSGQCIEGEFEGINIWFGRYKDINEFRQLALVNNISIVDGLNPKNILKSFTDINSFMVISNKQINIFAASLSIPRGRSSSIQSNWEFERVNWEATERNLRWSFSGLISTVSSSISYNAYPADIQNKILDLENWQDFGWYLNSFITEESLIQK